MTKSSTIVLSPSVVSIPGSWSLSGKGHLPAPGGGAVGDSGCGCGAWAHLHIIHLLFVQSQRISLPWYLVVLIKWINTLKVLSITVNSQKMLAIGIMNKWCGNKMRPSSSVSFFQCVISLLIFFYLYFLKNRITMVSKEKCEKENNDPYNEMVQD